MSFINFESEKEFIEEIKRKLGWPVVKVELDDSQWQDVLKQTRRWFMAKKSLVAMVKKSYPACGNPISFGEIDSTNGVYKILEVIPDESQSGLQGSVYSNYYELLPNGYPLWGDTGTYGFGRGIRSQNSYLVQILTQIEQRRKIYGAGFDWSIREDYVNGHALYLFPSERARQYIVIYKPKILPINLLEGWDSEIFFRWGIAETKETLGIIRSKYKDYPAAGGTISTDGPELLEQAKEEKERLQKDILTSQGPDMPLFG